MYDSACFPCLHELIYLKKKICVELDIRVSISDIYSPFKTQRLFCRPKRKFMEGKLVQKKIVFSKGLLLSARNRYIR